MKLISRRLGRYCAACEGGCCTVAICRETKESPFLIQLRRTVQPDLRYRNEKGWQRSNGCGLDAGRPPICHEFTCNEIDRAAADSVERYVTKVLCRLITHLGKKAAGGRHLVEIDNEGDLQGLAFGPFAARLREAEEAFTIVKAYFSGKSITPEAVPFLSRINPLPPPLNGKNRKKLFRSS